MQGQQLSTIRLYLTIFVTITIWSMLVFQFFNQGVPSHHLLHRADFPAISNWWGGLLLPVLTWTLLGRIKNRIEKCPTETALVESNKAKVRFIISLIYGAILSLTFSFGYSEISSILFPGILFFAIFFKVYREEFILGFILSMSITFGAVLPTIFATLIGLASAVVYFTVHFIWQRLFRHASKQPTI